MDIDHITLKAPQDADHFVADGRLSRYADLSPREAAKTFKLATVFCLLAGLNALNDGYGFALPGNVIALPGFIEQFGQVIDGELQLKATDISIWGAAYTVGYIVVLLLGTYPNDKFGRKVCILLLQAFMAAGTIMQLVAQTSGVWAGAKVMQGLSVGLAQVTIQSYVSEVAPTAARGAMLTIYSFGFALGQLSAAIATYVVSNMPANQWRHAIYSEWVLIGLALIGWIFLPESPRWYASRGKNEQGKRVLGRINRHVTAYDLDNEWAIIEQEVAEGKAIADKFSKISYFAVFRGTNLRRLLISFGPFAWQQWIGAPVIFTYTAYFFQLAGLANPFNGTLAVFLILVIGNIIGALGIDRVGRRTGLLLGGAVMISSLAIVGGVAMVQPSNSSLGAVIIAFSCVWVLGFALFIGPVGYTMLAETSTVFLRSRTTSIAAGGTGLLNLVTSYAVPLMLTDSQGGIGVGGTALFFVGTGALGWILVFFFIPETQGRSYIELDELFERRIPARRFKETKTSVQMEADETRGVHA